MGFLDDLVDNVETAISGMETIRIPEDYFKKHFIPYLTGDKGGVDIYAKIFTLTHDGQKTITLEKDGEVVRVLPALVPSFLSADSTFDRDMQKAEDQQKLFPVIGDRSIEQVLVKNIKYIENGEWNDYITSVMKELEDDSYINDSCQDDDDEFEILYD